MQSHLVDEAAKIIPSVPVLVNVISKRVRQLSNGHKPMIEVLSKMGLADIALTEVIQGKIGFEFKPKEEAKN
jgi:DNA-directed RNA polymerase subunit omega